MRAQTRFLSRGAVIAALYAALTLALSPVSFGAVQFRLSEALTVLPCLMPEAVPGLALGCLIANLLCGAPVPDVLVGTLATLLAALATRKLRNKLLPALLMPPVLNGTLTGGVVYFCYVMGENVFSLPALLFTCLTVFLGEAAAVFLPGYGVLRLLRRMEEGKKK